MQYGKLAKRLTIVAAVVGLVIPAVSGAVPYRKREIHYFDDAAHTNEVGVWISNCEGSIIAGGVRTAFYEVWVDDVCTGNGPD